VVVVIDSTVCCASEDADSAAAAAAASAPAAPPAADASFLNGRQKAGGCEHRPHGTNAGLLSLTTPDRSATIQSRADVANAGSRSTVPAARGGSRTGCICRAHVHAGGRV
jgi:hypothetical protein